MYLFRLKRNKKKITTENNAAIGEGSENASVYVCVHVLDA